MLRVFEQSLRCRGSKGILESSQFEGSFVGVSQYFLEYFYDFTWDCVPFH